MASEEKESEWEEFQRILQEKYEEEMSRQETKNDEEEESMSSFQKTLDRYITPYYKAQTVKKQTELDELAKKYEEINSKLQVRKVYELEVDTEICCEECMEVVHNHIEECPICKVEFAATDSYCNLDEPGFNEKTIKCVECNSYLKLVEGRWYGWDENSPKVVVISEEECKAEESYSYKYE